MTPCIWNSENNGIKVFKNYKSKRISLTIVDHTDGPKIADIICISITVYWASVTSNLEV